MFWGMKITSGVKCLLNVEKSFHISHCVLDASTISNSQPCIVELHMVVNSKDYLIALFSQDMMQRLLNLDLSVGEQLSIYLHVLDDVNDQACVHLSGYYHTRTMKSAHTRIKALEDIPTSTVILQTRMNSKAEEDTTDSVNDINSEDKGKKRPKKRKRVSFGAADTVLDYDVESTLSKISHPLSDSKESSTSGSDVTEAESVKDLTIGHGKIAKNGKTVFIRYMGKEASSKQVIDKIGKKERPLSFVLGRGEVMQGLDIGMKGMRVGGKRRIVIPPNARKSNQTSLNISKHATLVLDVELINVQ